eukprot:SAG11_NODE_2138_length_3763_cov_2.690229_2_plen_109_part_00
MHHRKGVGFSGLLLCWQDDGDLIDQDASSVQAARWRYRARDEGWITKAVSVAHETKKGSRRHMTGSRAIGSRVRRELGAEVRSVFVTRLKQHSRHYSNAVLFSRSLLF